MHPSHILVPCLISFCRSFARCPGTTTWAEIYLGLCSFAARSHYTAYQNASHQRGPLPSTCKRDHQGLSQTCTQYQCEQHLQVIHMFVPSSVGGKTLTVLSSIRMMQQMVAHTAKEPILCGDLWRHKQNSSPH